MLQKDPANRVSAFEALEHKWFKMHPEIQTNNDRESNGYYCHFQIFHKVRVHLGA